MRLNSGQCHKYNGKLINPNHIKSLFDNTVLLNKDFGDEKIIKAAPIVGSSAHQPGNKEVLFKNAIEIAIKINPKPENHAP